MILITLGSQKFPFDRLLKKVDEMVADGTITEPVFAQTGYSVYVPQHYDSQKFLSRDEFAGKMKQASLVITHGGTGAIIGAVKAGIKVIAVPRLSQYGEHVDDHQQQIVKEFGEVGIIEPCLDLEELPARYRTAQEKTYRPFVSQTQSVIDSLDAYLQTVPVRGKKGTRE